MNLKRMQVPLVIKGEELTDDGSFKGYGSVFGVVDSYRDVVEKGAFLKSIKAHAAKGSMPALLWQHDPSQPIGVYTKISEDENGLYLEGKLALLTRQGREAYELLKMGALSGLSIGFNIPKGGQSWSEEKNINYISEVDLWETSIVTFPANEAAQVQQVRSTVGQSEKDFEKFLRDAGGFSKKEATAIVCHGFKGLKQNQRDVEENEASEQEVIARLKAMQKAFKI